MVNSLQIIEFIEQHFVHVGLAIEHASIYFEIDHEGIMDDDVDISDLTDYEFEYDSQEDGHGNGFVSLDNTFKGYGCKVCRDMGRSSDVSFFDNWSDRMRDHVIEHINLGEPQPRMSTIDRIAMNIGLSADRSADVMNE